ncbi:MAG: hypothetical protein HY716_01020 [Planctomycetes bacterium]|nr:hypothetical protein [Planctomycetota bacterium]
MGEWDQEEEQDYKDFIERWGLGRINAYLRARAAFRLHDRQVAPDKESDKYDLAQQENTLWVEYKKSKPFQMEWLEVNLLGRVVYDSSFSLNDDIDVEPARDDLEFDPDVREVHASLDFGNLGFKVGRQIVVWGESDIFRVIDWANPVDLRRGFFNSLEEVREPVWMMTARYGQMDWGFELVVNPGDYQDDLLAKEGSEFYPHEAWEELRHNTFLRTNAAVYAQALAATPPAFQPLIPNPVIPESNFYYVTEDDRPHRQLRNAEVGLRLRYMIADWDLHLTYINTIADRPVLETVSTIFDPGPPPGIFSAADNTMTITTRLKYQRLNLVGATFAKDVEMGILRGEIALSVAEEFTRSTAAGLELVERHAFRYLIGFDRPTYFPLIAEDRTALLSFQVYQQYIPDAKDKGVVEVPFLDDVEDFETAFSMITQFYYLHDALLPQFAYTRDLKGAYLFSAGATLKVTNNWHVALGTALFGGPTNHGFGVFAHRDQVSLSVTYHY